MIASGATGWYIGQSNEPSQWTPHTSIEQAYRQSSEGASPLSPQSEIAPALGTDDLGWLSDNISLTFRMPDLTAHGFKIVNAQKLATSSGQVARLTYASESGEDFSLFLRVRWEERDSSMQLNEDGKISMAFWLDGPLASAVISKLPLEKTRAIAETVRSALRDQNVPTPLRNAESIPVPQGNAETVNQNQDQLAVPLKQPELKANGVSLPTSNTPAADRL
jgi:anti-sigma factor RsiW